MNSVCTSQECGTLAAGGYVQLAVEALPRRHRTRSRTRPAFRRREVSSVRRDCLHASESRMGRPAVPAFTQRAIHPLEPDRLAREDGCRRFRRAYITAGRKWGKSLFASAIMKLLKLYDTPIEPSAEVYSIATAEDQARLVYDDSIQSNHHLKSGPIPGGRS